MLTDLLFTLVGFALALAGCALYLHFDTKKAVANAASVVSTIQADVAVLKAKV